MQNKSNRQQALARLSKQNGTRNCDLWRTIADVMHVRHDDDWFATCLVEAKRIVDGERLIDLEMFYEGEEVL